ncbi:DUF805 domain-containing protein [Actomonas aquatica]|uniref:DUF805 domain-containing protein n=1 Tax=Actomonas aquatica TaxID=2866162 RepID=A0ABZ1CC13_9BACT|nr:DUF805 domain-containing protein [Opitutus sp. WL0086]WRQ88852.1 DUF805 domain-containing protein [Opitutus sp. WL0086]
MMTLLFPRKIDRIAYLIRMLIFVFLCAPVSLEMARVEEEEYVPSLSLLLVSFIALIYWFMFIVRPRCRDCGWSPWISIVSFVPFLNLCLWIALLFPSSISARDEKADPVTAANGGKPPRLS